MNKFASSDGLFTEIVRSEVKHEGRYTAL